MKMLVLGVCVAACALGAPCRAQPGEVVAWGNNFAGQGESQTGSFIAVSGTNSTSVAIRADGTLFGWGDEFNPAINVPGGTYTDIDGGSGIGFYIARRTDGTLTGWGTNNSGQASPPSGTFLKASAGEQHALGVRTNGSLAYWGIPWGGSVPQGTNFVDVAAGNQFSLALRADGTLEAWGDNFFGQLNVPAGTYTAVAAMANSGAAIRTDGTVALWGQISSLGPLEGVLVTRIVASDYTVIGLRVDGTLVSQDVLVPPSGRFGGLGAGSNHWLAVVPSPGSIIVLAGSVLLSVRRRRSRCSDLGRR